MQKDELQPAISLKRKRNSLDNSTFLTDDHSEKSTRRQHTHRKTKRIRSLVSKDKPETNKRFSGRLKLITFVAISAALIGILWKNDPFREKLKHVAMNQFQLYLHGRENYCNEPFEHWHISNALHNRIIGQENALAEIDLALQQHKNITALAFIGTQGVGKTLTLNLIQEKFQWHLNIQQYIWSLIRKPHDQMNSLLKLISGLTKCGQNGIFIDSIPMQHIHVIENFNKKILEYSNANYIRLIVIYVFQTHNPNVASEPIRIDNVKSINFRQFNTNDIHNCISMESERMKIDVTPDHFSELISDIDAERHGCKHVAARIARQEVYG